MDEARIQAEIPFTNNTQGGVNHAQRRMNKPLSIGDCCQRDVVPNMGQCVMYQHDGLQDNCDVPLAQLHFAENPIKIGQLVQTLWAIEGCQKQ